MNIYCKTCGTTHSIWNRLNDDSAICGRCGTRVRNFEATSAMPPARSENETDRLRLKRLHGGA